MLFFLLSLNFANSQNQVSKQRGGENKVPKTKKGVPVKYVAGSKNPSAREAEIKRTAKLYKEGKLTPAMMDRISKERSQKNELSKK